MMILNEEKFAKDVLMGQRDNIKSIKQKIDLIARYNRHVLNKNNDESYYSIIKWLEKHHEIFNEQSYSNIISDCIKKSAKRPFYHIDSVKITKNEMRVIAELNNLRHEKILFTLLCMAKVQKISHGFDNGLVFYNITELFKMSRVSVPVGERENILHEFLKLGLIGLPFKNDTKCLFVKFIDDNNDNVVLELDEQDCDELAYAYIKYTDKGKIVKCSRCGKLMKQSQRFGDVCRDCRDCNRAFKVKWCIDCGQEFQVDIRNMTKCRCEECQRKVNKEKTRQRVQKYRENNNM